VNKSLSILLQFCFNFAFKFKLRGYNKVMAMLEPAAALDLRAMVGQCRLTPSKPR